MQIGVAALAAQVRAGELSAREALAACLERIARVDPSLRAFGAVFTESAQAEANAADRALAAGVPAAERPLLGVPVAVKDEMDIAGHVTSRGTGAFSAPAAADAEVVARLRRAGAVIVGKTTMPELGLWPFTESVTWGVTRNPWDLTRTPGGSSGGSAAAVAAGLVPAAIAADGAGSIRIPAACCGLYGLKPSRGLVPKTPREDGSPWVVYGSLTRSVADTALILDVLAGTGTRFADAAAPAPNSAPNPETTRRASTSAQLSSRSGRSAAGGGRVRVGVCADFPPGSFGKLDPETAAALDAVAERLGALGHDVRPASLTIRPVDGPLTVALLLRGATDNVAEVEQPERLERRTRAFARPGRLIGDALHRRLLDAQAGLIAAAQRAFDDVDVLLTPVLARPAAPAGAMEGRGATVTFAWSTGWVPFNVVWNVTGQAAASVPAGVSAAGLPLAVQLVARPGAGAEELLLALSAELERELPWADRWPALA